MTSIDAYFHDIRKSQQLTQEQEQNLARRIQAGDQKALQELALANTKFVVTVARGYLGRGLELGDLIGAGNLGLMKAAAKFDPNYGFRFITYAVWWIRQSILESFSNDARMVRLPINMVGVVSQISKASELFESVEGRLPSEKELHKLTKISIEDIRVALGSMGRPTSLNKPVGSEEDSELSDLIEDQDAKMADEGLRQSDLEIDVQITLKKVLSSKEYTVVSGSFGIGETIKTDEEIGKEIGTGPERVRQLRENSLKKLRKSPETIKRLRVYLG